MIAENIKTLKQELGHSVELIVVSKYRTVEEIMEAYSCGQRNFAENRVQALLEREAVLPKDIIWHLIGHLQTNKVKYIASFIRCIQSVDSLKLLKTINEQAERNSKTIDCLLQIHIADEESKFGLSQKECNAILQLNELMELKNIRIRGLMGMATNTNDTSKIESEFKELKAFYDTLSEKHKFDTLSMGMSSDYKIAIANGSNMVRVGSKVFE